MTRGKYVEVYEAREFLDSLDDESVELFAVDPPYNGAVDAKWDNAWASDEAFAEWLSAIFLLAYPKLTPTGSLLFFGGSGFQGNRGLLRTILHLDSSSYVYRNWITWKKRRAYGKSHDYLYCREELIWYSKSPERTGVTFNVPYLDEKHEDGGRGWNPKYQTKSEHKRVSNVWADINELFAPERVCEKPLPLAERIVLTHSNPGDLVADFFCGLGAIGVAALANGRRFRGGDLDPEAVEKAEERCRTAAGEGGVLDLFGEG